MDVSDSWLVYHSGGLSPSDNEPLIEVSRIVSQQPTSDFDKNSCLSLWLTNKILDLGMKCIACLDKVQLPKCQGSHIRWEYPWGISGSNYNSMFLPSNLRIYWPGCMLLPSLWGHGDMGSLCFSCASICSLFTWHMIHHSKETQFHLTIFVPFPKAPPTTPQVQKFHSLHHLPAFPLS